MEKQDLKNTIYRWTIVLLGLAILTISSYSVYTIALSVTDQNRYTDINANLYIKSSIPGTKYYYDDDGKVLKTAKGKISEGSLLRGIDQGSPLNAENAGILLNTYDPEDSVELKVYKLTPYEEFAGFRENFKVAVKDIPEDFAIDLPKSLLITEVSEDGVSDIAGLMTGDIIVKINNSNFNNMFDAQKILTDSKKTGKINYTILRDSELINLEVKLAKFELKFSDISLLVIGFYTILLGLLIGFKRFYLLSARYVSTALILLGGIIIFSSSGNNLLFTDNPKFYQLVFISITLLGVPVFFTSLIYFPYERKKLLNKRCLRLIPFIISSLIILIFIYNTITNDVVLLTYYLTALAPLLYVIYYNIIFFILRDKEKNYDRRFGRAINFTVYIFSLALLSPTVITIFDFVIPPFEYLLISILLPLSYTYTLIKYGLLDNAIKVRRNILYTLVTTFINVLIFVSTIYVIVILSQIEYNVPNLHFTGRSIEVVDRPLSSDKFIMWSRLITLGLSMFVIFAFRAVHRSIIKNLEERFQISKFDYKKALSDISELSQKVSGSDELAKEISQRIASFLRVKRSGVIFFNNSKKIEAQSYYGINDSDLRKYFDAIETRLINVIDDFSGNIIIEYLPEDIQKIFTGCHLTHIVPMRSKGRLLGILMVGDKLSESAFNSDDISFLRSIGSQAAIGIENMFLYLDLAKQQRIQQELELARQIQLSSLPQGQPNISGLDISGTSIPALEVGGDFYDFYTYEDNGPSITLVIGDVSGKGTSAALYMSKIQGILQTLQEFEPEPADLLSKSNSHIYSYLEKSAFITATCANFNTSNRIVKIARAGHLPLYYYNSSESKIEKIIPKGIVMGLNKGDLFNRNLDQIEIPYNSGDIFLMVTDGITEARNNAQNEYQEERLIDFLTKNKGKSANEITNSLLEEVKKFTMKEEQFDDITVVVVKVD